MNTCGGCDRTWTGLRMAHCAACHNTFSTVAGFDLHRRQHRVVAHCVPPGSLRHSSGRREGEPVMRLNDRGVWVSADPHPISQEAE